MRQLILILIICTAFTYAQALSQCHCNYYPVSEEVLEDKITGITLSDENLKLPEGEIYNQWSRGDILLNNGEKITNRIMRYDGIGDQLIVSSVSENVKLAVEKSTITGFDILKFNTDSVLHYKKLSFQAIFSNDYEDGYAQVLVSGKTSLYASRRLQHVGATNQLEKYYSYIIVKEDGTTIHFLIYSRRYIASLFPEKKGIFKPQLRKQRNRIKNEDQLIKAIKLYNTL